MEGNDTTYRIVREFTSDDIDHITWLIYHTDLGLMRGIFGTHEKKAFEKIKKNIELPTSFFSKEFIYGIKNTQGLLTGILIGYTGEASNQFRIAPFLKTFGFLGILRILIIGSLFLFPLVTSKIPYHTFYISNLSVHPQFRGKGFGRILMREAFKIAQEKNCDSTLLDVSIGNIGAIALYKKLGFSITKTKKLWFSKEATYTMERPVEKA